MSNNLEYIVVQAGGKGTRMERLTRNKPKALTPVKNLPMIFHLFRKYPDKKYIIIGDYKIDVLSRYLEAFADVDYKMVSGAGHTGTCAGMQDAMSLIPEGAKFMLIWCDLILPAEYEIPDINDKNIIGISKDFPCRWKYENNQFVEERSTEYGVAGHFIFKDKSYLKNVPTDGELVRWMQGEGLTFEEQPLYKTKEYGLISEWEKIPVEKCRPFNSIEIVGDHLIKRAVDAQGEALAVRECAWYKKIADKHFVNIPAIYGYTPLEMELIDGKNIYELSELSEDQKKDILKQIVECLESIHKLESVETDKDSFYDAYLAKTWKRLEKVKKLVPFAEDEWVTVNGVRCHNIFYEIPQIEDVIMKYLPDRFCLLHGDCTFSNMMLRSNGTPVMIDPRGYFGTTEFFGDVAYDWVKLYYSLYSNYDQFNLKRFDLTIDEQVSISVESNGWEALEPYFFELLGNQVTRKQMKLFLAIIWLSLTTYAWDDYDSICGAFYLGLLYLEEAKNC